VHVTAYHKAILKEHEKGEGAFDFLKGSDDRFDEWLILVAMREEVKDRLGVRGRREYRALLDQLTTEVVGVREVSVVGDRRMAESDIRHKGLNVSEAVATGGGISNVTNRDGARKFCEVKTTKYIRDEAEPLVDVKMGKVVPVAIHRYNTRALLSPMLLGVEAEIGQIRRLRVIPHRHEATFVVKLIITEHSAMPQRSDLVP
jgi:hypothetical protein